MVLHEGGDYREMISGIEPEPVAAPTPEAAPAPESHSWLMRHPYLAGTIAMAGLVVLGASIVLQRIDVSPSNSSGAWGGAGGMFFGTIRNALPTGPTADDVTRLQSPPEAYAAIPIYKPSDDTGTAPASGVEDITELLAQLVQKTPVTASANTTATPDSYSFIPQGLVSTETPVKKRTPEQEKLFQYGNEVGTYIKGYEDMHPGSFQILKDHVEDRTNQDKIRALRRLGEDMQQLGSDLKGLQDVPASAAGMHKVYANAYYAAGANLALISETSTDEEFVSAVGKYNVIVEKLSTQFQLLVVLFGTNEVTFSSNDQGNIFMFNANLSMLQ